MNRRSLIAVFILSMLLVFCLVSMSNFGRSLIFLPLQLTSWCDNSSSICSTRQCLLPHIGQANETHQVVFIKVHKAASSTVQNILLRFTMDRNLTSLLPRNGPIISQISPTFAASDVLPHHNLNAKFDILCSHVIYDNDQLDMYFEESAPRIAILREPLKQVISALIYYTTTYHLKPLEAGLLKHRYDPINGFLQHPQDFCGKICQQNPANSFVNNRMSVDLGFSIQEIQSAAHNQTVIQAFLQKIENEMDLVLISDYFDESMILLRRHLQWPMKDIIYLKVNTSPKDQSSSVWTRAPSVNETNLTTFRQWAFYDYALYDHFLPIFFGKIESECLFYEEVEAYKLILHDVVNYCKNTTATDNLKVPEGKWNKAFSLSSLDCHLMASEENEMVNKARNIHLERNRRHFLEISRHIQLDAQRQFKDFPYSGIGS